jgi:DNA primase large subunit
LKTLISRTFVYALEKREEGINLIEKDDFNLIFFYMIKTILASLNNRVTDNHVANFLSSIYYKKLLKEQELHIVKLANYMGITSYNDPKRINGVKFPFWVEFQSYIPVAAVLKDHSWHLINREIEKGRVYLLKDNLARLLKEKIRKEIIPQRIGSVDDLLKNLQSIQELSEIYQTIENKVQLIKIQNNKFKKSGDFIDVSDDEKPPYELYPPCIKYILDKALEGENLVHNERLHIAFFFANTNHTVEETIDVFRTVPDFSEEIARYNVEFSRGIGGKGKKYKSFNCSKLKSFQICKANEKDYADEICSKGVHRKGESKPRLINSPLNFIFWKKVEIARNRTQGKKFKEKNN